ncbi:MAG: Uma2 family endonuclease [Chitinophagales bacterium]
MKAHKIPLLSVPEYIIQEQENHTKYEYHNGKIFALAGGTLHHGLLCGNIYAELRSHLKTKKSECKPFTSEIKLRIKTRNSFVYPDAMMICGKIETSQQDKNAVTNPILVVEVLSKSTANYDRGDKFFLYRQIPSLREYVLISQDKPQVDVFYKKQNTDLWQITRFEGLENAILLQSLNLKIAMSDLYFDINLKK